MELSDKKLEEMVVGKNPNPNAVFFEQAVLNVERSKAVNKRMYDKKVFIRLSHPGVRDSVSYEAQKDDIAKYREEYQYFLNNRQGDKAPGIEIIPNLDIAHLQELRDYGLLTIPQLAASETVPPHLEYARDSAIIFNNALKEANNGNEEESNQETVETQDVPAVRGREQRGDVGRSETPRSNRSGVYRETPQGHEASRREHRGEGVNWASVRIV